MLDCSGESVHVCIRLEPRVCRWPSITALVEVRDPDQALLDGLDLSSYFPNLFKALDVSDLVKVDPIAELWALHDFWMVA